MNIIDIYLNYSHNNILKYSKLLVSESSSFRMQEFTSETLDKVIRDYSLSKDKTEEDEIRLLDFELFLDDLKIKKSNFRKLGMLLLKEIKDVDAFFLDDKQLKFFKVLYSSILVAIELNKRTCSIVDPSISFKKGINEIIEIYTPVLELDVLRQIENDNPKLKELYDESLKIKRKLIKHYTSDKFDLKLSKLTNCISKDKYVSVDVKYNIKSLEMVSNTKINEIIEGNIVKEDIVYIILDKLSWLVLNSIIKRTDIPNYIIEIPNGMFKTKKSVKIINRFLQNSIFKKHIIFKVDYNDVRKYSSNVLTLKQKNALLAIDKIPKEYDKEVLKNANYIIFDKNSDDVASLEKELKIIPMFHIGGNRSNNFTIGLELNANK